MTPLTASPDMGGVLPELLVDNPREAINPGVLLGVLKDILLRCDGILDPVTYLVLVQSTGGGLSVFFPQVMVASLSPSFTVLRRCRHRASLLRGPKRSPGSPCNRGKWR